MIITAAILFSALFTLVFFGLKDCFEPISRYLDDRFGETENSWPFVPVEKQEIITLENNDQCAFG